MQEKLEKKYESPKCSEVHNSPCIQILWRLMFVKNDIIKDSTYTFTAVGVFNIAFASCFSKVFSILSFCLQLDLLSTLHFIEIPPKFFSASFDLIPSKTPFIGSSKLNYDEL